MYIRKGAAPVATVALALGMAIGAAGPAAAVNNIKPFGVQETLKDMGGSYEIGYTVDGLKPSTDPVAYPVHGQLYEATVTADALQGSASPAILFFNARAESGDNYRVLSDVSTLSGASLPPGGQTTGKVYFDVVGDPPNSVVINDGAEDLLAWFG